MIGRLSRGFLGISGPLICLTFFWGDPLSALLFTVLATAFPVALIVLGTRRPGEGVGPLTIPLFVLLLILEGTMLAMFAGRGSVATGPWIGGLPWVAAVQLYGLFLLPLGLVAFAHGLTFDRWTLRGEDLDRLRRRFPSAGE